MIQISTDSHDGGLSQILDAVLEDDLAAAGVTAVCVQHVSPGTGFIEQILNVNRLVC